MQFFLVKTYKRDQWNLPNILAYISGIFDGFFKAGLVPLKEGCHLFDKKNGFHKSNHISMPGPVVHFPIFVSGKA